MIWLFLLLRRRFFPAAYYVLMFRHILSKSYDYASGAAWLSKVYVKHSLLRMASTHSKPITVRYAGLLCFFGGKIIDADLFKIREKKNIGMWKQNLLFLLGEPRGPLYGDDFACLGRQLYVRMLGKKIFLLHLEVLKFISEKSVSIIECRYLITDTATKEAA